jgi:copper oxidase (laccase) domain-containing protein
MDDAAAGIAWTGAPRGVRGVATVRSGPGVSAPPFDAFNLGLRSGDDADAVRANRAALGGALAMP